MHMYVGSKYGFAQSMDCVAQTMDPYFVQAIHGLRIQVVKSNFILFYIII